MMLVIAAAASIPLFLLARRGEIDGNRERFVGVIVGCLLIESLVYPAQVDVPVGPFRIPFLGGNVRTQDYLVVIGVLARVTTSALPRQVSGTGVLWFVTGVWMAAATARGFLVGHPTNVILFSAMSLVGLFGSRVLVGGCSPERLIALLRGRWLVPLGAIVLFLIPNSAGETRRTFFGTGFGVLHVDTASVFVALGTFVLLVEWSAQPRRPWAAWAALPLLLAPFAIDQRATIAHFAGTVVVIVWAVTRPQWIRTIRVRRAGIAWGLLTAVAVSMVVLIVHFNREDSSLPFAAYYDATFASEGNQLSAQARVEALEVGLDEWAEEPLYGQGLGHRYEIDRPGGVGTREPGTFDNVPLDVLVRAGLVGLVLFVAAAIATVVDGLNVWRRDPRATFSALALAAVAVLVGLGAKSLFESILEKGKLALAIGLSAGVIAAVVRSRTAAQHEVSQEPPVQHGTTVPWI